VTSKGITQTALVAKEISVMVFQGIIGDRCWQYTGASLYYQDKGLKWKLVLQERGLDREDCLRVVRFTIRMESGDYNTVPELITAVLSDDLDSGVSEPPLEGKSILGAFTELTEHINRYGSIPVEGRVWVFRNGFPVGFLGEGGDQ
jgi:hypothetical protein